MTYKPPKPQQLGHALGYTADTLRAEVAAAEQRGAEAMRERCAQVCDNAGQPGLGDKYQGDVFAAAIRSLK